MSDVDSVLCKVSGQGDFRLEWSGGAPEDNRISHGFPSLVEVWAGGEAEEGRWRTSNKECMCE